MAAGDSGGSIGAPGELDAPALVSRSRGAPRPHSCVA
jgi:hypothetical protein